MLPSPLRFIDTLLNRRLKNFLIGFSTMDADFDTSGARPRRSARLLSTSTQTTQVDESIAEESVRKDTLVARTRKRKQIGDSSSGDTSTGPQWKASVSESPGALKSSGFEMDPAFEPIQNHENSGLADPASNSKKRRRYKPAPVYIIPDVKKKNTTFKGRLGYACLNTVLRNRKPATESVFCSRTCRLDSLEKKGIDFAKDLGRKNVEDLLTVIQWNEDNNIRLFRLSSEMFPYASHGTYGYTLEYCAELLAKAGALANKYGHRLTTHPGQFTQLGSPKPNVVEASVRELVYHCQMLDLMGMGPDSVMIIHGGGVYNDKPATLRCLKQSIEELPNNVRKRIVLENDEMCYNAEDLLPICEELSIPFVFDYHHDILFPSSMSPAEIIKRANAIWSQRGIRPKQHLSEPRPGAVTLMEKRAHSDRCENLPVDLPNDMDLMIEAKDKEQAVLYLHRMYNLQPVNHDSLRPATISSSTQTNGRKSTKRARIKVQRALLSENDATDSCMDDVAATKEEEAAQT